MSEFRNTTHSEYKVLLAAAGLDVESVSVDRQLLPGVSGGYTEEVFTQQLGGRLLVTHDESPDIAIQEVLKANAIATLEPSDVHIDGLYMWTIPPGSYSLNSVLHLIAQNTGRYGSLLLQAQNIAENVEATGVGALSSSEGRGLLDHFVVVQTGDVQGVAVVLAPPYVLSGMEENEPHVSVHEALLQSDLFRPEDLDGLFSSQLGDPEGDDGYY